VASVAAVAPRGGFAFTNFLSDGSWEWPWWTYCGWWTPCYHARESWRYMSARVPNGTYVYDRLANTAAYFTPCSDSGFCEAMGKVWTMYPDFAWMWPQAWVNFWRRAAEIFTASAAWASRAAAQPAAARVEVTTAAASGLWGALDWLLTTTSCPGTRLHTLLALLVVQDPVLALISAYQWWLDFCPWWSNGFMAAIMEEPLKRIAGVALAPYVGFLCAVYEAYLFHDFDPVRFTVRAIVHVVLGRLPLRGAVWAHGILNVLIYALLPTNNNQLPMFGFSIKLASDVKPSFKLLVERLPLAAVAGGLTLVRLCQANFRWVETHETPDTLVLANGLLHRPEFTIDGARPAALAYVGDAHLYLVLARYCADANLPASVYTDMRKRLSTKSLAALYRRWFPNDMIVTFESVISGITVVPERAAAEFIETLVGYFAVHEPALADALAVGIFRAVGLPQAERWWHDLGPRIYSGSAWFRPEHADQAAIGLLGSGASKGDGPETTSDSPSSDSDDEPPDHIPHTVRFHPRLYNCVVESLPEEINPVAPPYGWYVAPPDLPSYMVWRCKGGKREITAGVVKRFFEHKVHLGLRLDHYARLHSALVCLRPLDPVRERAAVRRREIEHNLAIVRARSSQEAIGLLGAGASKGDGPTVLTKLWSPLAVPTMDCKLARDALKRGLGAVPTYCPGYLEGGEPKAAGNLFIRDLECKCEPTLGAVASGFSVAGRFPHVSRGCQHNVVNGLIGRVMLSAPTQLDAFADDLQLVAWIFKTRLATQCRVTPTDFDKWVARFPAARAQVLRDTFERWNHGPGPVDFANFVKGELLNKVKEYEVPEVWARSIQNPHPATTAYYGPRIHALGEQLKKDWNIDSKIYYTSGANAEDLGRWFMQCMDELGQCWFVEVDCSRWDGRFTAALSLLEAAFDARYGASWDTLAYELQVKCNISWKGAVRLACLWLRMSGVNNTSKGNSQGNAIGCLKGLKLLAWLDGAWRMCVLGDDNGLVLPKVHSPRDIAASLEAAYKSLGHKPKVKVQDLPLGFSYCSGRMYLTTEGTRVWAPKVGRALAKMGWQFKSDLDPDAWLAAAASSWRHDVSHVPVLRAVAQRMCEWVDLRKARSVQPEHRPHAERQHFMPQAGLLEFCELYDVMPSDVLDLEARIARWERGAVIDDWLIEKICAFDIEDEGPATEAANYYPPLLPVDPPPISKSPDQLPDVVHEHRQNWETIQHSGFLREQVKKRNSWLSYLTSNAGRGFDFSLRLPELLLQALDKFVTNLSMNGKSSKPAATVNLVVSERKGEPGRKPATVAALAAVRQRLDAVQKRVDSLPKGGRVGTPPARGRAGSKPSARQSGRGRSASAGPRGRDKGDAAASVPRSSSAPPRKGGVLHAAILGEIGKLPAEQRLTAAHIMIPQVAGPFRPAVPFDTKDTAVSMTWETLDAAWSDATVVGQQLPRNQLAAVVLREVGTHSIVYDANNPAEPWSYQLNRLNKDGIGSNEQITSGEWFSWSDMSTLLEYNPHGDTAYPRMDYQGNDSFWLDMRPTDSQVHLTQAAFSGCVHGAVYVLNARRTINKFVEEFAIVATADPAGTFTFDMPDGKSGYWSLRLESGQAAPIDIVVTGTCSVWGHRALPNLDDFVNAIENVAVTSSSLMYTNTAAPLNRQGKRAQLQVPGGVDWPELFGLGETIPLLGSATSWSKLSKLPGVVVEDIIEGAYSPLKPTGLQSYARRPNRADDLPPVVDITPADDYVVILADIDSELGKDGYWTILGCTYYETLDQTRERAFASGGTLKFQAAHDNIGPLQQHYTNAFHIADLLGKAAGAIMSPTATALGEGLSLLNKFL